MSSLFEIPAQLAMLLSLAATAAGGAPVAPNAAREPYTEATVVSVEPLEGPLRYGERAWLQALYDNPEASRGYAERVFATSGGRFYVPTESDRLQILNARKDASLAARVAHFAAERNARRLSVALQRPVSAADLYLAHVLGPAPAIALLKTVSETPDLPLAQGFPTLAGALTGTVEPSAASLTVGDFYRRLCGSLREPPRLVAIGLKPRVEDAPRPAPAWHVKVDIAKADELPQ